MLCAGLFPWQGTAGCRGRFWRRNHARLPAGQAGNVLEVEAVFEAFEGFLDTPALVVEVTILGAWEVVWIEQVGHQHAYLANAGDVPDQAHRLRCRRTFVVGGIAPIGRRQRDDSSSSLDRRKSRTQAKPALPAFSTRMQKPIPRALSADTSQRDG